MNIDAEMQVSRLVIDAEIESCLYWGSAKIDRMIAEHKAWIRYWPESAPNRRSAGQFLRHMRARK